MEGSFTVMGFQVQRKERGERWWGVGRPYPSEGPGKGSLYAWGIGLWFISIWKWGHKVDWRKTRKEGGG